MTHWPCLPERADWLKEICIIEKQDISNLHQLFRTESFIVVVQKGQIDDIEFLIRCLPCLLQSERRRHIYNVNRNGRGIRVEIGRVPRSVSVTAARRRGWKRTSEFFIQRIAVHLSSVSIYCFVDTAVICENHVNLNDLANQTNTSFYLFL